MPKSFFGRGHRVRIMQRAIIICMAIAVMAEALLIYHLYSRVGAVQDDQVASQSREILIDAILGLNNDLVTEPTGGLRTIPSLKIAFPAAASSAKMYYRPTENATQVYLIDAASQAQAIAKMRSDTTVQAVYRDVSDVQLCSRQVVLALGDGRPEPVSTRDEFAQISTKRLQDGRSLTLYQARGCPYPPDSSFIYTIKQVESR